MNTAEQYKTWIGKKIHINGSVYTLAGATPDKGACTRWPMYGFNDAIPNCIARYFTHAEIQTAK